MLESCLVIGVSDPSEVIDWWWLAARRCSEMKIRSEKWGACLVERCHPA